ncbi:MAG TPA: molybdopterin molybdotransferase MoeA [Syntrophomonas sp.]|nr:molybdopterin molybdotransferase MoeA [Syntrophomonas sp.]
MQEFLKVLTYQNAREILREHFSLPSTEMIALQDCFDRILADDIISPENMPAFTRSTVDGYAFNCTDSYGSSESLPGMLAYIGSVSMGKETPLKVGPGQCAWMPTGGMLPEGSNAVIMVEYTERLDEDTVLVFRPVGAWENVMQSGEDIAAGDLIFSRGHKVRPQDIGLLASLGIKEVSVYSPYHVGILSTGDEIIPFQEQPRPGQIRDVNTWAISAALQSCGAVACPYPLVKDDLASLKQAIAFGLKENDLLLVSGGSSIGIADYTLEAMLSMPDSQLLFHGIAIKPGKPTLAVKTGSQLIIGLPGHPVSALMIFHIICAPLLRQYKAWQEKGRLTVNVASQAGRDDFIPAQLINCETGLAVKPLLGKSGLMNILAQADGYIHIPYEKQGLPANEEVPVTLF